YMNGDNASIEGGGDVIITADAIGSGTGGNGILLLFGADIKTMGSGNLTITATGASVGSSNYGINMNNGSTSIQTQRGNLSVNAFGAGNSGGSNHGINMGSGALIYSSGIGDVRIKTTAGYSGYGLYCNSGTTVQADSGTLEITAVGNGSASAFGMYRAGGGGGGIIGNYGDSLIISATGTGTQNGFDGYGGSLIGGSNFAGELVIKVTAANSDHLNLSPYSIQGTGHFTLAPLNAATTIGIAGGTGAFNLSTSDLGVIQNGFHKITIGRSDGTGTMTVNGYTFNDSLEILSGTGSININGNLSVGSNGLDIATDGTVLQNSGVSVTAGAMSVFGAGSSYTLHMTAANLIAGVSALTLNGNSQINDTLFLGSAVISTGANMLTLGSSTSNVGVLMNAGGSISGSFKRWFDAATVSDVQFPFAVNSNAGVAALSFTSAPTTGGTITGSFSSSDPGSNGFPVTDGSATLAYPNALGYWSLTSGDGLSGGTYDVKFDVSGTTFNNLSKLHVVKRTNSSSAWTAEGTHTLATTESGPVTRAYRSGLTSFSEFAIGMESGTATTLSIAGGNYQAGPTNSALAIPFAAHVTDGDGDPVLGESITFAITGTPYGATGQSLSASNASTNGSGNGLSTLTTGNKPGNYQVTASSGSLTGSPVTFNAHVFDQTAGTAITLDGSDDYLESSNTVGNFGTGNFTIEAWIKTTSTSGGVLVGKRYDGGHGSFFVFSIGVDGKIGAELDEDGAGTHYYAGSTNTAVNDGNWHHVALSRNGITVRYYIDGTLDKQETTDGVADISNSTPLTIGARYANEFGYVGFLTGSLDEVRIWNVERTASEIRNNIHNSFSSLPSGLAAYWQFSDGTGSANARDVVNGFNAQLTDMNVNSAWVPSAIPFGPGTTSTASAFTSGTATPGTVSF
ncbi:MAG: LamG-like jellyroll fold domain-containing protein, partial [Bacteroidota bacterium]